MDLKSLKRLVKVKLSKVSCEETLQMAEKMNSRILHLELVCMRESLDLSKLAVFCPNLQSLEIYYSMGVHLSTQAQFGLLQKLVIYCTEIRGFDTQKVNELSFWSNHKK